MSSMESAGIMGKDAMDTSLSALTRGLQQVASETTDFTKASYEQSARMMEQLLQSRSLDKVVEVQKDYATAACEAWVAQTARLGDIYADMARESCKPFEALMSSGFPAFRRTA